VGLGTPAVVRLVGALAHVKTPSSIRRSMGQRRRTTSKGHQAARRHLIRTRRSNRPTLRRAAMQVNYSVVGTPTGETATTRENRLSARVVNLFALSRACRPVGQL
jgi:hypothetical protein